MLLKLEITITMLSPITYKKTKTKRCKVTMHKPFPPPPSTIVQVVIFWLLVVNVIMLHPTKVSSTLIWVIVNHVDLHHESLFFFLVCKCDMLLGFAKGLKFPLWYVEMCKLCGFTSKACLICLLVCKCGMFLGFVKGSKFPFWYAKVVSSLFCKNPMYFYFYCRGDTSSTFGSCHGLFIYL